MNQKLEVPKYEQISPYNILVTGATGFIGSKLAKALVANGYTIKCMTRQNIENSQGIKYVKADAFDPEQLEKCMDDVDIAFYLLHSMEGNTKNWQDFANREKTQAQNFLNAAMKSGVKRIIYLGGLVNESLELSPHMQSRKDVGDILRSGNIQVTELRASLIIGAQGGSYAMLRYLVERLRVMVCPSWVKSLAQPIAVDDVIDYLVGCISVKETAGKIFDIGGPERLSYEAIMRQYAAYLNKNLFIIEIPFLTTRLSSYWVDLITPVKASLARPLIDSLVHDTIVENDSIKYLIPMRLKTVLESIDIATKEINLNPPRKKSKEEKTSFIVNQKILMCTLITMALIGSTYYWLDNRTDVFQPWWIFGSFIWYLSIGFAILFVHNKTRLGYLIAGILSWITLAFWMFDNYHVAFQTSIIAQEPSLEMTIRNFAGIVTAGLAVFASHNVFHKVREYQKKGTPL